MSRGGFQRLSQFDVENDEEVMPIGGSKLLSNPQPGGSQNFKFPSYGSSHIIQPFNGLNSQKFVEMVPLTPSGVFTEGKEVDVSVSAKSQQFRISATILLSLGVVLGMLTLSSHYAALKSAPDLQQLKKHPPLSIIYDQEMYKYRVIDNYPLLKPNKIFNKLIGIEESNEHVLAYGTCARNVNGNGWNYLSAQAVDLSGYSNPNSVLNNEDGTTTSLSEEQFDDLISQEYFRSLEAIGYLEGYSTCVEMNEWYVNFYSGMFDGGNPTDESMEFLLSNHDWMVEQSNLNWQTSDYWRTVRGMLSQLTGIVNGANAGCPGTESNLATAEKKVYLDDLSQQHSIIHILLLNANGDMYQLDDKYSQYLSAPSDVLEDIPNDDGYFFELINNVTETKKAEKEGSAGPSSTNGSTSTSSSSSTKEKKGYYYDREEARQRIEARKQEREKSKDKQPRSAEKNNEAAVGGHLRSRRSQRRLTEMYAAATGCDTQVETESTHRRLNMITHRHDHCSALIKVLDDKSDILFGHDTWDDFQNAAPRIFKHYTMNLMKDNKPSGLHEVQFSSSPGMVTSNDDYFVSRGNANIAVIETTIDMSNRTLLNDIIPQSMLSWGRFHIANQLATDGQTWCDWFSMYHSGTYVNQWMIMNFDKFTPLVGPQPGFLHVLEEVPTYIHYDDVTPVLLSQGYWASYNEPYFSDIAELSLNAQLCAQNSESCYNTDPRAEIFKRDQGKIMGLKDMQWMMGYNNFQNDPLSLGNACQSVACRNDLQPNVSTAYPFGAIDSKISSVMLSTRAVPITVTRLGPTHDEQQPFCWAPWDQRRNSRGEKFHHAGHPACFDFDWQTMPPFVEV
jgi:hypothetical protein